MIFYDFDLKRSTSQQLQLFSFKRSKSLSHNVASVCHHVDDSLVEDENSIPTVCIQHKRHHSLQRSQREKQTCEESGECIVEEANKNKPYHHAGSALAEALAELWSRTQTNHRISLSPTASRLSPSSHCPHHHWKTAPSRL